MDHPNIAKVHDGGATETGRPYFVMELVRGIKITDFCDEKKLSTRERLDLFTQVCHAVQHAHQKGIIHRDLKPSNILVTVNDGVAVPKIIDFGIAKATQMELTEKTVFTRFHQFIGTPAYLSPEQAEITSVDIDTRSDIYSLGVLLYELLTGKTPFDGKELLKVGLDEMRRTIREKEPERPSTRVSTLGDDELTTTAKRRGLDPPKLANALRGDLDWIVMKCLEKDRARRYETANGLAMDIQRHLNSEPVVACPPSPAYKFRKLVRRNKGVFTALAAITTLLVFGIGAITWEAVRARQASRLAGAKEAKAQQVSQFLKDMLEAAGPEIAKGRDATILLEILDKADARVGKELTEQPAVEAELRQTIGQIYIDLGKYQRAEQTLRRALTIERALHPAGSATLGMALDRVGRAVNRQGRFQEAEALFREALATNQKFLGNEHHEVSVALGDLAMALRHEGKIDEARPLASQALELDKKLFRNDDPEIAESLMELALDLGARDSAEAEVMLRQALAIAKKAWGSENPRVAVFLSNLANSLLEQNKWAEAEKVYREALAVHRKLEGENHPAVATALANLTQVLIHLHKLEEAEGVAREAVEVRRKTLGDSDPGLAHPLNCLGDILLEEHKFPEAEVVYRDSLQMRVKLPNERVAYALNNLAGALAKQGKFAEAETTAREGLEITGKTPSIQMHVADGTCNLASILMDQKKFDEAEELYNKFLSAGPGGQATNAMVLQGRGNLFGRRGQWQQAEADLTLALASKPVQDPDPMIWYQLAAVLAQLGNTQVYHEHCRKCLQKFAQVTDPDKARWISRGCLILPSLGSDLKAAGSLARIAVAAGTNHLEWTGFAANDALAEYRQGRFADALEWGKRTLSGSDVGAPNEVETHAVLAMAFYQLKQTDSAARELATARAIAESKLPKLENGDLGGGAFSWIIAHALVREAEGVVEGQTR